MDAKNKTLYSFIFKRQGLIPANTFIPVALNTTGIDYRG